MAGASLQEKVENRLMDLINQGAEGRLVVFKPQDAKIDLAVQKRSDYRKKPIYFKVFTKKEIPEKKDFLVLENLYLLFAEFDFVTQDISNEVWLISSLDARESKDFSKFKIDKKVLGSYLLKNFGK